MLHCQIVRAFAICFSAHGRYSSALTDKVRLCVRMSLKITKRAGVSLGKKPSQKTWREIHQERKKRREEKFLKQALKKDEEKLKKEIEKSVEMSTDNSDIIRTCSIAVPGSILANAQSPELSAYLAGQVARAACIYKINEVIIYDDEGDVPPVVKTGKTTGNRRFCVQFARLLQYLECPQYLRKKFFPLHHDLQYAGLMNPLDAPHHLRQDEDFPFREGITTDKKVKKGKGTYVNVGLLNEILVSDSIKPGFRVTVELKKKDGRKKITGNVVPPDKPLKELNAYWGYSVRIAGSLSEVFSKSPYSKGYDLTIGTSERGTSIDEVKKEFNNFAHGLIVFGGLSGLEAALENDTVDIDDVSLLFDHYINTCPQQGSRTIRTEEAILITLAELRRKMFLSA